MAPAQNMEARLKSLSWIWHGCDPTLQAEMAAGTHDAEYPRLRAAYLDAMAEAFARDAVAAMPTTGSIN
jgi:hypothetical protein